MKDFVYVIEFGEMLVKVGRSIKPSTRARHVSSASGRHIKTLWVSPALSNATHLEKRTHEALSAHRGHGEWFSCSAEDAIATVMALMVDEELWSQEREDEWTRKAKEGPNPFIEAFEYQYRKAQSERDKQYQEAMVERATKNYMSYLALQDVSEDSYWQAVKEEREQADLVHGVMPEAGKDEQMQLCMMIAYSSEKYQGAKMAEHMALGTVVECCMLVFGNVEKIPEMLEQLEARARQRLEAGEIAP